MALFPPFLANSSYVKSLNEEAELTEKVQEGKRVKPIWNQFPGIDVHSTLSPVPVKSYDP